MGMSTGATRSDACTSMHIMVATRKLRFSRMRTRSMGVFRWFWRMKNHTTHTVPTSVVPTLHTSIPDEPTTLKPYRRPPKPSVDNTTDSGSRDAFASPSLMRASMRNAAMTMTTTDRPVMT